MMIVPVTEPVKVVEALDDLFDFGHERNCVICLCGVMVMDDWNCASDSCILQFHFFFPVKFGFDCCID